MLSHIYNIGHCPYCNPRSLLSHLEQSDRTRTFFYPAENPDNHCPALRVACKRGDDFIVIYSDFAEVRHKFVYDVTLICGYDGEWHGYGDEGGVIRSIYCVHGNTVWYILFSINVLLEEHHRKHYGQRSSSSQHSNEGRYPARRGSPKYGKSPRIYDHQSSSYEQYHHRRRGGYGLRRHRGYGAAGYGVPVAHGCEYCQKNCASLEFKNIDLNQNIMNDYFVDGNLKSHMLKTAVERIYTISHLIIISNFFFRGL